MILVTDIGHDPDDAIALSYLIEHGRSPTVIVLTPGFPDQVEIAAGICNLYGITPDLVTAEERKNGNYNPGKHKSFLGKN